MKRIESPPLITPLRASIALHAIVLGVFVLCLPEQAPRGADQPLSFRISAEAEPDFELHTEARVFDVDNEPVHTRDVVVDFDVLLPPADVEETLPPEAERVEDLQPPLEVLRIPEGATRKPRAAPPPAPAAPTAKPAPPRARPAAVRVVRRPGMRRHYPREARRLGIEGVAMVLVHVGTNGQVTRAVVRTSSGNAQLDRAALRVARLYEFAPGAGGRALLPVRFRLRDL